MSEQHDVLQFIRKDGTIKIEQDKHGNIIIKDEKMKKKVDEVLNEEREDKDSSK